MLKPTRIECKAEIGANISACFNSAAKMAEANDCVVHFEFNGAKINVKPDTEKDSFWFWLNEYIRRSNTFEG